VRTTGSSPACRSISVGLATIGAGLAHRHRHRCPQRCLLVRTPVTAMLGRWALWLLAARRSLQPRCLARRRFLHDSDPSRPNRRATRGPARKIAGRAIVAVAAACGSGNNASQVSAQSEQSPEFKSRRRRRPRRSSRLTRSLSRPGVRRTSRGRNGCAYCESVSRRLQCRS